MVVPWPLAARTRWDTSNRAQADVVVLSGDPLSVDPSDLATIEINGVWIAGQTVH